MIVLPLLFYETERDKLGASALHVQTAVTITFIYSFLAQCAYVQLLACVLNLFNSFNLFISG